MAGTTGVTVTEDGRPVGVLTTCHDHIDGAMLYEDGAEDRSGTVAQWSRTPPAEGLLTWPLTTEGGGGGGGWSVDDPMPAALERGRTYSLYGWTSDNSWSTAHVTFTLADLAALRPGQVRYFAGDDAPGADRDGRRTASMEEFRTDACP
ncbi:hypothetical protein P1P75_25425 [Streptomyces sp. ID05-39B]|uniref:hypothetical protein n=1 Tax=Streptomyces sp. ID05-39B TaxID=3028664 RepID=UPI0029ABA3B6|nr:hypothetical protein [Streptomyces sp. ID05-39B]MDX3529662.1 hypothetical protein [Streptomyces sp. ID05-39B]